MKLELNVWIINWVNRIVTKHKEMRSASIHERKKCFRSKGTYINNL